MGSKYDPNATDAEIEKNTASECTTGETGMVAENRKQTLQQNYVVHTYVVYLKIKIKTDNFKLVCRCRLKGHSLQVRHKQDWGRAFIFLRPRMQCYPDQMLAVMLLSQYRVLSSKTSDLVLQVVPDVWSTLYDVVCGFFSSAALTMR